MELKSQIKLEDGLYHLADIDTRDDAFAKTLCGQFIHTTYARHYEIVDCPDCLRVWLGFAPASNTTPE